MSVRLTSVKRAEKEKYAQNSANFSPISIFCCADMLIRFEDKMNFNEYFNTRSFLIYACV